MNEFGVIRSHHLLREDLDRMVLGSAAVEAVAAGVEEGEASPELFRLLSEGLELLEGATRPALVTQGFFLHLLRLLDIARSSPSACSAAQPSRRSWMRI
jgi:recombinational DNA repair protein (RecF pathway)